MIKYKERFGRYPGVDLRDYDSAVFLILEGFLDIGPPHKHVKY